MLILLVIPEGQSGKAGCCSTTSHKKVQYNYLTTLVIYLWVCGVYGRKGCTLITWMVVQFSGSFLWKKDGPMLLSLIWWSRGVKCFVGWGGVENPNILEDSPFDSVHRLSYISDMDRFATVQGKLQRECCFIKLIIHLNWKAFGDTCCWKFQFS